MRYCWHRERMKACFSSAVGEGMRDWGVAMGEESARLEKAVTRRVSFMVCPVVADEFGMDYMEVVISTSREIPSNGCRPYEWDVEYKYF